MTLVHTFYSLYAYGYLITLITIDNWLRSCQQF